MHFKLCTTHSKFFQTHFEFTTNSKNFATHFKIFAIHFEIFATHFEISQHISKSLQHICPRIPSVGREKGNGDVAPSPSFEAMFCSTCGESLQVSFKFCTKCRKDLAANLVHGSCDVDSQKNIIETYFLAGFGYDTIVSFLEKFHDIHISLSTLKQRLMGLPVKEGKLGRSEPERGEKDNQRRIAWPCCMSGYRAMWHTLGVSKTQTSKTQTTDLENADP